MKPRANRVSTSTRTPTGELIHVPCVETLNKYGLDAQSWLAILEAQGWRCAICHRVPDSGRMMTDHWHRPDWKKLAAKNRRKYVRGITCWWCNKSYLGRGITEEKALNMYAYLRAFSVRLQSATNPPK